mmetsp:Transcript_2963/g.4327  ORF Transcript_2963/g.4327 Transcript_2963/m.4327 type:complete len:261 (-) Transcript_2963:377-1159(-)
MTVNFDESSNFFPFNFPEEFDFTKDMTPSSLKPFCFQNSNLNFPINSNLLDDSSPFVSIKHAKARESDYKTSFPKEMTTTPYKYDLRICQSVDVKSLHVKLVYENGENLPDLPSYEGNKKLLPSNVRTKLPLEVNETSSKSDKEHVVRFSLNVCSFHHHRRKFCISISDGKGEIFRSTPFKSFARRKNSKSPKSPPHYSNTPVVAMTFKNSSFENSVSQAPQNNLISHINGLSDSDRMVVLIHLLKNLNQNEKSLVSTFL